MKKTEKSSENLELHFQLIKESLLNQKSEILNRNSEFKDSQSQFSK